MLTIKQAAPHLGVSENTVRALCSSKLLRHVRVGVGRGRILIPEDAIADYLARRTIGPEAAKPAPVPIGRPLRHIKV